MKNVTPAVMAASMLAMFGCGEEPEAIDQTREFVITVENTAPNRSLYQSGTLEIPDGQAVPGLLHPGDSYSFEIAAAPGVRLQLMTMFYRSNDAFVSFEPGGIELWGEDGRVLEGDRTDELILWDAGTEFSEAPGTGLFQGSTQSKPGVGIDDDSEVVRIADAEIGAGTDPDGNMFPAVSKFVRVELEYLDDWRFRVTLENVSPDDLLQVPIGDPMPALLSPAVYAVYDEGIQLFYEGEQAPSGIEALAEDGNTKVLGPVLEQLESVSSELSAVVWTINDDDVGLPDIHLYAIGSEVSRGIEALAEDADPQRLMQDLGNELAPEEYGLAQPSHGSSFGPGESVEFRVRAQPGDRLSLVAGYLAGNDKFIGSGYAGIPLFSQGEPHTGDFGWTLQLLDAGTEVDEAPALGPNQYRWQPEPGSGIDEDEVVRQVHGSWRGWDYPAPDKVVSVHIDVE